MVRSLREPWTSRPTASKNWGWCSESCYKKVEQAHKLQETQLDVLTSKACKIMGKEDKSNPHIEICTGKKRPYPTIETYEMMERSGHLWFERKVTLRWNKNVMIHFSNLINKHCPWNKIINR